MAHLKITSLGSSDLRVEGKADALVAISSAIMRRSVRMAKTHLLMKITIIPRTSSMIKGMTGNASHQGNGRLFKESKEPRITFIYLIARRTWCPSPKWKSKVLGWHSSMERYMFGNRIFKDVFEFKVVSNCRKSTGDHVH